MKVARSDVGRNAAGMHVLPGGGPIWLEGRRINIKIPLTHSLIYTTSHTPSLLSIDTKYTPKQLAEMEGLKNAFAQCKKEGRVSSFGAQLQMTPPLHC